LITCIFILTYFLSSKRLYLLPKSAATNMAARSPKAFRWVGGFHISLKKGGWVGITLNRFLGATLTGIAVRGLG
jgi:hypothetical protein